MRLYHLLGSLAILILGACQQTSDTHSLFYKSKDSLSNTQTPTQLIPSNVQLKYSRHARCRMDCRHITDHEIEEVLEHGTENIHSTVAHENDKGGHCPKITLEADTDEGQKLRVVFAYCKSDQTATVVTCIDLGKEWQCDCH